ncbi:MAG: hypothetical protein U9N04_01020 [Patescibacteria group bacterium]|nr:hypothetical protein [Patescibacteria group bacterium]
MLIKQNIPWYRTKYYKKNWQIKKNLPYIFYCFKNSLAEKEIDKITQLKKKHRQKILSFLNLKNDQTIHYYLYPTFKNKLKLMGDDSPGNSIWEKFELVNRISRTAKFEIHVMYNNNCKFIGEHEDTHLLSLPWGLSIYLFCEGLAQFMEGGLFGRDIDEISKELLRQNKLYSLLELVDNNNWNEVEPPIIYPQVGSFARFLIESYGLKKFKSAYQKLSRLNSYQDNLSAIRKEYFKGIDELEKEWKEKLITSAQNQKIPF